LACLSVGAVLPPSNEYFPAVKNNAGEANERKPRGCSRGSEKNV
jgi:hypothetical protein